MFYSIIGELDKKLPIEKDKNYTEALWTNMLEKISNTDKNMADEIHNSTDKKMTVSRFFTEKDSNTRFRITILEDKIYQTLINELIQDKNIKITGQTLKLSGLYFAQTKMTRYAQVEEEETLYRILKKNPGKLTIKFISPTIFRRNNSNYIIPEPHLIFSSLARRWNSVCKINFEQETITEIVNKLIVSNLKIKSEIMYYKNMAQTGFTGFITFDTKKLTPEEYSIILGLKKFGFYSSVGAKTSFGFGQII